MIGPTITGKPRYDGGPITMPVYGATKTGDVCAVGTGGNVGKLAPATAGQIVFGVATTPGLVAGTSPNYTAPSGYVGIDMAMPDEQVAFARKGAYYLRVAGTPFVCTDFVKVGTTAGTVQKWVPGTDAPELRVGQCIDPAGGVNGGGITAGLAPSLIDLKIG